MAFEIRDDYLGAILHGRLVCTYARGRYLSRFHCIESRDPILDYAPYEFMYHMRVRPPMSSTMETGRMILWGFIPYYPCERSYFGWKTVGIVRNVNTFFRCSAWPVPFAKFGQPKYHRAFRPYLLPFKSGVFSIDIETFTVSARGMEQGSSHLH